MSERPRRIRPDERDASGERMERSDQDESGEVTSRDVDAAEDDPVPGAESGAVAGAVAGTLTGGPIGGFIGATLGGVAGAGSEAVDDEAGAPGGVEREQYEHPVRVRRTRETGRDARGSAPEEGRAGEDEEPPAFT